MGTAIGAAMLLTVFTIFVYTQTKVLLASSFYTPVSETNVAPEALAAIRKTNSEGATRSIETANNVAVGATAAVIVLGGLLAWRLMNKPRNVDFLVSTDVEMKKVNWPTKTELYGSTKIVIIFLFIIALILFLIDVGTGVFFQIIGLLKFGPLS